ncbi:hypothetical protein N657DRAFT_576123 [Parathielavia appendiculata]|uniref:NIMA interactive protein n=1 Tax=Parathielavia appendiculata TaxID=2587402 RepID=A0AAN6TYI2_9PEZI|nr:hypothetical protein N657DRAFT_576123 [Parathielavia appendiculata]
MIELENLRTASLYINNQLLSRGLLRGGSSIDFAHPGDSGHEVAETMSRIMGVVNDLILRRDRDAEHRESLSAALRTLRAESLRQANDIQRLQEKHAEAQRKVGLSEAAEAALRTHLKSAEATIHRLKEEAARTKTLVAQTRASCANEVRKRDRQIEGLKKAVTEAGRARGAGRSTGVTSITVVGDIWTESEHALPSGSTADQGYDLRTETNAFLAELAKNLSDENEGLLQLIRRTMEQLKEMSGWDVANEDPTENGDGHAVVLAANPADLSLEINAVLEHLRTILTNPSFVPIEEVVVREDEIHRLRDGWEKMETRWKEAVHLIDGWRKRMQASGRPVNVEELKMGLRLSPVKVKNVEETSQGYALRLEAVLEDEEVEMVQMQCDDDSLDLVPGPDADTDSDASSEFEHNLEVDELDLEEPNVEILQQSIMLASPPLPQPPQLSVLRDSYAAGNRGGPRDHGRHPGPFTTTAEEKSQDQVAKDAALPPLPPTDQPQQPPSKKPILSVRTVPPEEAARVALPPSALASTPDTSVDSIALSKVSDEPTSKNSAVSTKPQKRPAPSARKNEAINKKEGAKKEVPRREPTKTEASRRDASRRETAKKKEGEETKHASRPPAKPRSTRPPITRGRSDTRPDEKPAHNAKGPRAASAASATSTRSTGTNKSAGAENLMSPPPLPVHGEVPSPSSSPGSFHRRVNSRLPLPRPGCNGVLPAPQQSPLSMATIAAKLAASEREADAARVRAKLKAARLGKGASIPPSGTTSLTSSGAPVEPEAESNVGAMSSTRSESDSVTGSALASASASASTSDGAPSSATTRDDDVDELGLSPPTAAQQQSQKHRPQQQPSQLQQQQRQRLQQQQQLELEQAQEHQKQQQQQQQQQQQEAAAVNQKKTTRKREKCTSRVASRRRSTLNPWELDALIQGGKAAVER